MKSKNTESWLPIRSILNGAIQLDDGMQVTGVKVQPKNIFIMDYDTQKNVIYNLRNLYNTLDYEFSIIVADRPVDVNVYLSQLQLLYNNVQTPVLKKLVMQDINKANLFMSKEVVTKSNVPTVEKKIVENQTKKDETTAKVGDVVNFELTGTLPSNYEDYTSYQYEFHDTLSKGLTYNGNVEVYVKNGTDEEVEITGYTVTPAKGTAITTPTDNTPITVKFADLKADTVKALDTSKSVTIDANSKIIVKYSATLNENAVVGEAGNTNTVKLVYSNDPNGTSTGTTKDDKATVYTFQLNVVKVDGATKDETTPTKLQGAKFKLYYEKDGTKYYATVNLSEGDNKNKITGWTTAEADGTELTTDTDGNITVKGLKEGAYYLEETEAPAGYNKLTAPVKVEITKNSTNIHELDSVTADNKSGTVDTNNKAIGMITIANNKGSTLPSTGGMGTKLFYTIGGILMAGAAIVLVVRKRRSDAE